MASCKDCIHYELCRDNGTLMYRFTDNAEIKCAFKKFKNKADFAEVVHCENCESEQECNKEIYIEGGYCFITSCSYGKRKQ